MSAGFYEIVTRKESERLTERLQQQESQVARLKELGVDFSKSAKSTGGDEWKAPVAAYLINSLLHNIVFRDLDVGLQIILKKERKLNYFFIYNSQNWEFLLPRVLS